VYSSHLPSAQRTRGAHFYAAQLQFGIESIKTVCVFLCPVGCLTGRERGRRDLSDWQLAFASRFRDAARDRRSRRSKRRVRCCSFPRSCIVCLVSILCTHQCVYMDTQDQLKGNRDMVVVGLWSFSLQFYLSLLGSAIASFIRLFRTPRAI
jgi:hypothetical protein